LSTTGVTFAAGAALLFVASMVVESVLLRWRINAYFQAGFPLFLTMVPIPNAPEGSGSTATVRWEVTGDLVRWWADPAMRSAPSGLHGSVQLAAGQGGVHLFVRWAPPWTPLLAAAWLIGLGMVRGEAMVTLPIGLVMIAGVLFLYRQAAVRAVAEMRWAWVQQA